VVRREDESERSGQERSGAEQGQEKETGGNPWHVGNRGTFPRHLTHLKHLATLQTETRDAAGPLPSLRSRELRPRLRFVVVDVGEVFFKLLEMALLQAAPDH